MFVKTAKTEIQSSTINNNAANSYAPRSPDGPPPGSSSSSSAPFAFTSPGGDDAFLTRILKVREIAIRLAGGEDIWDELDEDAIDVLKEKAERELDNDDS